MISNFIFINRLLLIQLFAINLAQALTTIIMKKYIILCLITPLLCQEYSWPTGTGKNLSSNFGEFRTTGYHLGIDVKTKGTEGHPIYLSLIHI